MTAAALQARCRGRRRPGQAAQAAQAAQAGRVGRAGRWVVGWAVWLACGGGVVSAQAQVAVIVAPQARPTSLPLAELAQIYRRQKLFVADARVQPINLPANHPLRRWFSQQVLGQMPEEMDDYWRDLYFNGVLPPFVLGSEEAVIRFVAATPNAIGYVSHCAVDKRVRVLMQLEGGPACSR